MIRRLAAAVAYLETLNPEQRRAVEHGVGASESERVLPLLVIAGAGSGKTNTLAHRVAHLIVNGADPRRILLLDVLTPGSGGDDASGSTDFGDGPGCAPPES